VKKDRKQTIAVKKTIALICQLLARGNHKGNSVEKYHPFLNKTQMIVGQDTFVKNSKTSQYAWNRDD